MQIIFPIITTPRVCACSYPTDKADKELAYNFVHNKGRDRGPSAVTRDTPKIRKTPLPIFGKKLVLLSGLGVRGWERSLKVVLVWRDEWGRPCTEVTAPRVRTTAHHREGNRCWPRREQRRRRPLQQGERSVEVWTGPLEPRAPPFSRSPFASRCPPLPAARACSSMLSAFVLTN